MLHKIIARKRDELKRQKQAVPLAALKERIAQRAAPLDLAAALRGEPVRLIAEVKRASPSRGILCPDFDPVALATGYARGGAAAISVLTEENYFGGSLDHLVAIRDAVKLPLLRKDFIFDTYQIYETAAHGGDALLLIVATLNQEQLSELLALSHRLSLKCLVEVHNETETDRALLSGAEIIGINNRNLTTFETDINTSRRLRPLMPRGQLVVSESGIRSREDIKKLKQWQINAVLIGETLVTAADAPAKIKELLK
ncbi:MAG: indole-3-glycerol phosphate synthase TrpC [Dehalococcoidales bacterium]|nr:indole-3-glycerol phosphate synthase TrpC [Dehalococcoidales bacterium]